RGVVAGGVTGALDIIVSHPTDFIKTQMQLDKHNNKYLGTMDCIRKTIAAHGIFGLYRGIGVLLLGNIPRVASRFGVFEYCNYMLKEPDGSHTALNIFFSGLLAGITESVVAITPIETIKVKILNDMYRDTPRYRGMMHATYDILKHEGIRGIYKGLSLTIIKQGSNQAIRFYLMCTQKEIYTGNDRNMTVPTPLIGLFGILAGAASLITNMPVDVIKTRMQGSESLKYKSAYQCFQKTLKEEGPRAFFKGTVSRLARVCIDVALTFMIYESIMDYLLNNLWT
ncbi:hypothetical protein KR222_002427, partial [Zaprionus bogoriensis]